MIKKILLLISLVCILPNTYGQALDNNVKQRLEQFFREYTSSYVDFGKSKLEKFEVDHHNRTLKIYADKRFAYQPFREENTQAIYRHISQILPGPVASYDLSIYVGDKTIQELIPNYYRSGKIDKSRIYEPIKNNDSPWVTNISKPYKITNGLDKRHISLWQSHGMYYINKQDKWDWQRPRLFCTNEDQFTQSFILPFLIPMLEKAGANVFTPRERDIQKHEVIVDNDIKTNSLYIEEGKRKQKWDRYDGPGFAASKSYYFDGENPFLRGTSRVVEAKRTKAKAFAQWVPTFPIDGNYAVYISYQSMPNSVSDAKYIVFHKGGITEFLVNQKIGGGTWVYLGNFEFSKGNSPLGMVVLTNESKENGVISADAVRFGGGMGNIIRGSSTSGMPRYLEGARYSAQWAGMPTDVYNGKKGTNDYADDINTRSNMINYLSGGSVFNPRQRGLGVPFELNLALHSDAGYNKNDKIFGTLGIYTTEANPTPLGSGKDRLSSRDFADIVLTQLEKDIHSNFNIQWTRRSMWDRNYSETRLPEIPSIIIELLSHQNFADMQIAHDPNFKFIVSRAIYKAVLKYLSDQKRQDYIVQPLPIKNFSVSLTDKNKAILNWSPTEDPIEPSASAKDYIVYTRIGNGGFDNGKLVHNNYFTADLTPGLIYSFKVAAVNKGGESFPSETLVAYKALKEKKRLLIVNGFQRLSGPKTINTDFEAGFDINSDPGVPYLYDISLSGSQQTFRRTGAGKSGSQSLGHSTDELEGYALAGNTFDYPYIHGKAIRATKGISFASTSRDAAEFGYIDINQYDMIDLIMGLQKEESYNPYSNIKYKTFTPQLQQVLTNFSKKGGSILVSGSYIASDMSYNQTDIDFIRNILNYDYAYSIQDKSINSLEGLGRNFKIPRLLNEQIYTVSQPEVINAVNGAFPVMTYQNINHAAAVASQKNYKTFIMGFPFESIENSKDRAHIMASILHFFMK